ncbi:MAG: hypothetical protein CMA65_02975 [Euryarchaeota archaeon]|nr:hypothetical protein [Euryarchaeota archaeon]
MDEDRERRMKALRERVQAKKNAGALVEVEEPIVINQDEYEEVVTNEVPEQDDWYEMLDRDADRWRNLAASLVLIGSILGIISGALILQGNPSEAFVSAWSSDKQTADISGEILLDIEGTGVENVTVELLDGKSKALLQSTVTNEYGYYSLDNVAKKTHILIFAKDGFQTVERTFTPDDAGLMPVTMKTGNDTRYEDNSESIGGPTLDFAVALASGIGIVTIIASFAGVQSAVEMRRGLHYRRSQYFAGFALFGRGFIIIGPTLILAGMILNMFAKFDFEDQRED